MALIVAEAEVASTAAARAAVAACTLLRAVADVLVLVEANITPRPGPAAVVMALTHRVPPAVPVLEDRVGQVRARIPASDLARMEREVDSMAARRVPTRGPRLQMVSGIRLGVRPIQRGQAARQ